MPLLKRIRQLRQHFGVSAPKLSVKTHVSWRWRALGIAFVVSVISWMVWTGYDAGRLLGGFYKSEADERRLQLEGQVAELTAENRSLVSKMTRLESEMLMGSPRSSRNRVRSAGDCASRCCLQAWQYSAAWSR